MTQALSQDVDESLFGPEADLPPEMPTAPMAGDGLDVKFYQRSVPNELKSWGGTIEEQDPSGAVRQRKVEGAGRLVCDLVDFVRIRVPGDRTLVQDVPVRANHKQRWPDLWRRYAAAKSEQGTAAAGTPLEMAPFLNPAVVDELKYQRIHTVEQLAGISDANLAQMGMGTRVHRDRAVAFVEAARSGAPAKALQAQVEQQAKELAVLKARLAEQDRLAERAAQSDGKSNQKSK